MTNKKLVSLTAAAAVLVALAYVSSSNRKVKAPSHVGKSVLPQIDLSEVARIETGSPDRTKLVLESSDSGWIIKSLFGYPADIAKIRSNLLALKDLKVGHVASGKKLEAPVLVDLQNAAGKSLAALRLGEKHMRQPTDEMAQFGGGGGYPSGRYVAAAGSDTVMLVKETLDAFDGDPKNWTETQISSVPSSDVTAIELASHGETLKLQKKDGNWTLEGLGEKEEFDTSKSYSLESALSYLNFNNIIDPALSEEDLGMTTGSVYKVFLKNGENYTAKIGNAIAGTDKALRISAAFTPTGTNATENAATTKKIEDFNAKVAKWTYAISSYSAENMAKKRSDLVKAKEEPKKEEPASNDDAKK